MAEEIQYWPGPLIKGNSQTPKKIGKYNIEFEYENSWMSSCRTEIDGVKKIARITQFQMKDLPPM